MSERLLQVAAARREAWFMSRNTALHRGPSNSTLRRYGFLVLSQLAAR